jgi:hypothetical protein
MIAMIIIEWTEIRCIVAKIMGDADGFVNGPLLPKRSMFRPGEAYFEGSLPPRC